MSAPHRAAPTQPFAPEAVATAGAAEQLGLLFAAEPAPASPPAPAETRASSPKPSADKAAPAPAGQAKVKGDTLPGWARAAVPTRLAPAREDGTPSRRVWSVAGLVSEVRGHIESAYPDLWVRGEISNLRAAPSGHVYFTLKDGDASLPAVMFRKQAQLLRFRPEDGLEVLLRGRVSVYEQRGQMQLIAEYLEPVGAGSLQIAFEQLKRKLEAEGLFAASRKRPLPAFPHCVGIVTSPAGAVIRDFLNVAGRRHAALDVLLYPAMVQGESAAAEIAAGIAWFDRARNVDVVVVARGGGSLEDLAPFNSERVARAIAACGLPVVSAVGHETDFTIADFVADLRAPTPSAAAELITAAQHRIGEHVEALHARLGRAARYRVTLGQQRWSALAVEGCFQRVRNALGRREQRLDEQRFRLERAGTARLRAASERLAKLHGALLRQDAGHRLRVMRERFGALAARLERCVGQHTLLARGRYGAAAQVLAGHDPSLCVARMRARVEGLEARLARAGGATIAFQRSLYAGPAQRLARCDMEQTVRRRAAGRMALESRLGRAVAARLGTGAQQHTAALRSLQSLSPLAVLGRGYALVFAADGRLVKREDDVSLGEQLHVRLAAGSLGAVVTSKESDSA